MNSKSLIFILIAVILSVGLAACSKKVLIPINQFNPEKSQIGEIRIGKIQNRNIFKKYGEFQSRVYVSKLEGRTIYGKILTNLDSTIEFTLFSSSCFRIRYRCVYVELNGFDNYIIGSDSISNCMTFDQVNQILIPYQQYPPDSTEKSYSLYYDYDGLFNSIHIEVAKNGVQKMIFGM